MFSKNSHLRIASTHQLSDIETDQDQAGIMDWKYAKLQRMIRLRVHTKCSVFLLKKDLSDLTETLEVKLQLVGLKNYPFSQLLLSNSVQ